MKNTPLENYLNSLEAGLKRLTPAEREAQLCEVRGHLETLIASNIVQGQTREEATRLALQQFGAPETLGRELNQAAWRQSFGSRAFSFAKGSLIWSFWFGVQFWIYTSANDKPNDFPYHLQDRLLWSAVVASIGFFGVSALRKRRLLRAAH